MTASDRPALEAQIAEWRRYLASRQAVDASGREELEDHLRTQVDSLLDARLSEEEAFLVAVKRMGALDEISREFAREHSERLWKQLVLPGEERDVGGTSSRGELVVVLALAVAAALAVKLPELFGVPLGEDTAGFFGRNLGLLVLPLLAAYFVWKRRVPAAVAARGLLPAFALAALFANVYPFSPVGQTEVLTGLHLPIVLWLVVGVAYAGGAWRDDRRRMDFVRFSGEWFIYYVLIALGGGVLTGFTLIMFQAIGIDAEGLVQSWILPCGAAGAVLVAAWLVEAKQSVVENMAPVLTRIFTPLFTLLLAAFLATMLWTGQGIAVEREVLIGFDLMLALVLGLHLYAVSARDPQAPAGIFDALQLALVTAALLVDVLALVAIAGRISEFGFSANKVAALGENLLLLVNLGWAARLYLGFLRGRRGFGAVERWQTSYLPAYGVWAAIVVVVFPPLFGYL